MARGPDPATPDEDILEIFVTEPDPAFVASEIADKLSITKEGARHRMEQLVEKGYLNRKKPGPSTVIYWLTYEGHEYYRENASS